MMDSLINQYKNEEIDVDTIKVIQEVKEQEGLKNKDDNKDSNLEENEKDPQDNAIEGNKILI